MATPYSNPIVGIFGPDLGRSIFGKSCGVGRRRLQQSHPVFRQRFLGLLSDIQPVDIVNFVKTILYQCVFHEGWLHSEFTEGFQSSSSNDANQCW